WARPAAARSAARTRAEPDWIDAQSRRHAQPTARAGASAGTARRLLADARAHRAAGVGPPRGHRGHQPRVRHPGDQRHRTTAAWYPYPGYRRGRGPPGVSLTRYLAHRRSQWRAERRASARRARDDVAARLAGRGALSGPYGIRRAPEW